MSVSRSHFNLEKTIDAFYTGGVVQIDSANHKIYCTCGDKITVINSLNGEKCTDLVDDEDDITCFSLSPDNKVLVTASKSLLNHQFDVNDSTVTRRWKSAHKTQIMSMAFDESSTLLATGSSDTTIKVYDIIKQYYTHSFKGSQGTISLLQFHPDSNKLKLFSASTTGKIRMWDLQSSKCLSIFEGHFSQVTGILFSSDNTNMISAGRDKVIIIWDLQQRKQIKTIPIFECIEALSCIPKPAFLKGEEKDHFVTAGATGCLRVWQMDGKCVYADPQYKEKKDSEKDESVLQQMFFDKSTQSIVAITFDHNILFYDVDNLKITKQFIGYYDEIVDLKYFGCNEEYIAIATNSEQIKVVHNENSTSSILTGHTATVLGLDVSYDGKYIASSSKDNSIRVWSVNDDTEKAGFTCVALGVGHTHHVGAVAWPKLSTDYLLSGSQDLTLKCWKLPNLLIKSENVELEVIWTEKAHDKDINALAVSPNDKLVVSASQDKTAKESKGVNINIQVWKLKSGKLVGVLRGHKRGIWCAQFSPVDQCIATGSADSMIKLWNLADYTCIKEKGTSQDVDVKYQEKGTSQNVDVKVQTLEGHANSVLRINFFNKGTQLISSGSEGLIKVWSIKNDECVTTLEGHEDKVWALAIKKNEDMLVSGGADSEIKYWKDITDIKIREEEEKEQGAILREQELSNLFQQKKFEKAIGLAITLQQPHRVFKIFTDMLYDAGEKRVEEVVSQLHDEQITALLGYMCDWNTNSKKSFVSQLVLSHILKVKHPDDLLNMTKLKDVIESLLPYTERHYERLNQLVQQSMFVDYTWETAKLSVMP